ncbi:hypothetical protein DENSPDRAFT_867255 [Dentipellis sp. KUC8613]|nr:hypothetical protein DENSPDRAFT_867255 [Dentipellis sp. KUC8613]
MALSHPVALSIFASYFFSIIALFVLILRSFPRRIPPNVSSFRVYTFAVLTVASFLHTWYYMLAFLQWSFADFERSAYSGQTDAALRAIPIATRIAQWLSHTALFEQAWTAVARTPLNWWWSEQICLFTAGTWTILLATYGRTHRIKHLWAYMLLGQLVAISVASCLFYLALLLFPRPKLSPSPSTPKSPSKRPTAATIPTRRLPLPPTTYLPVLLSTLLTMLLPPALTHGLFLPILLAIHILLVLPLLPLPQHPHPRLALRTRTLHALLLLLALLARILTSRAVLHTSALSLAHTSAPPLAHTSAPPLAHTSALARVPGELWATLHAHPAQASIGWDVVWTTLAFAVWARAWAAPALAALVSVGVVGPAVGVGMGA